MRLYELHNRRAKTFPSVWMLARRRYSIQRVHHMINHLPCMILAWPALNILRR